MNLEFAVLQFVYISEALRCVEAVAHFGERRASDLQEMQAILPWLAAESFNDVDGDRECGAAQLRSELEPFYVRECARETMEANEQVIRPLPRDD